MNTQTPIKPRDIQTELDGIELILRAPADTEEWHSDIIFSGLIKPDLYLMCTIDDAFRMKFLERSNHFSDEDVIEELTDLFKLIQQLITQSICPLVGDSLRLEAIDYTVKDRWFFSKDQTTAAIRFQLAING